MVLLASTRDNWIIGKAYPDFQDDAGPLIRPKRFHRHAVEDGHEYRSDSPEPHDTEHYGHELGELRSDEYTLVKE